MDVFLLKTGPRRDCHYLFLNLTGEQYQAFKQRMNTLGMQLWDKAGEPYPSREPGFQLFCWVPVRCGSMEQVRVAVTTILDGSSLGQPQPPARARLQPQLRPAQPQPHPQPAAAISLQEWEQGFDQIVRRIRRGVRQTQATPSDRLAIAEHIRSGQYGEALRELDLHERAGTPFSELARQYLWVYSEQGAWASVADTFERAQEHLEGSVLAHLRAAQAYLELALNEPRGSERRDALLARAHECTRYSLALDETNRRPEVEAQLWVVRARVVEAQGGKVKALSLRMRAHLILTRHGLVGSRQNEREILRMLHSVPLADQPKVPAEIGTWLAQLPDAAAALMIAADVSPEQFQTAAVAAPEHELEQEWAARLERWQVWLESSPAETGSEIAQALGRDAPSPRIRLVLRLLKLEADERVVGLSAATCAEASALWQDSGDTCSAEQKQALLWRLVRCAESRRDHAAVLTYGEILHRLPTQVERRAGEVLAKMGMAAAETDDLDRALRCLKWAQEQNWGGKQVSMALANVCRRRGDTEAELVALLKVFEEDPADSACLERLLEIYMERSDWENSLRICNQFLEQLQTPTAAQAHSHLYSYRKDFLDALSRVGRAGDDEAYAEAVEAVIEIRINAGQCTSALELFRSERPRLAKAGWLIRVASSLELGDGPCRDAAATEYQNLALDEIDRIPRHDHARLVDLLQRVWMLKESAYEELMPLFRDRQEQVNADATLRPAGGVPDVRERQLDLSGRRVVIVGAYNDVRQRAAVELRRELKLAELVEIPPSWERNLDQDDIRQLLQGADLVVEVPRCIKHRTTVAIGNILQKQPIQRVYAAGKGQTSIVRAVRDFFERQLPAGA